LQKRTTAADGLSAASGTAIREVSPWRSFVFAGNGTIEDEFRGGVLSTRSASIMESGPSWLRLEPRPEAEPFHSARNYGTTVYGKDKCGTKEKAWACSDWQGHSDRRAMASHRACGDRCLDRFVERQRAYSGTCHQTISSARAESEEMTKRPGEFQPAKPTTKAERDARKAFRQVEAEKAMTEHEVAQKAFSANRERLKAERLAREAAGTKGPASKPKPKK